MTLNKNMTQNVILTLITRIIVKSISLTKLRLRDAKVKHQCVRL